MAPIIAARRMAIYATRTALMGKVARVIETVVPREKPWGKVPILR
jgi:hypothetical protein